MKLSATLRRTCAVILVSTTAMAYAGAALAIEPGTLVVAHDTDPDDATLFTYMVDGQTPGGAGLDDDPTLINGYDNVINTKIFTVTPGDYTVSQADPGPGWVLDAIKCNGPTPAFADLANRKVSLNVATGTNITCRFFNKRTSAPPPPPPTTGKITIRKQTTPSDPQDFAFYAFGPNSGCCGPFQLDTDPGSSLPNSKTFTLPPGSYSFKEDFANPVPVPGWVLANINCTGGGTTVDMNSKSFTANLQPGQNIVCTFVNQRATGEIRIIKDAQPNSLKDFGFTGGGPGFAQAFILDDDAGVPGADNQRQNSQAFIVPAGNYVFTEALASPWVLTGITCTPSASTVIDQPGRKATITLSAGQTVTCTYRNKPAAPQPCLGNYPMNAVVNFYAPGWATVNICRGGTVTFNKTAGGSFTVTPSVPAGSFTPVPMAAGASSGTTTPFVNNGTTPITYKYWSQPGATQGSIIVW